MSIVRRIASLELWIVALLVGGSVVVTRLLPLTVAVAAVFWLVRLVAWRRLSVRTRLDVPIALLVTLLPITMVVTPSPAETTEQLLRLLSGIALYYAIVNAPPSVIQPRLLLAATLAVGALAALVTPLIATGSPSKFSIIPAFLYAGPSLLDEVINFNVMAGTLGLFFPFPLAVILFGGRTAPRWLRALAWTAAVLLGLMLLWTQSRGAIIGVVVMGLLLLSLRWRWGWLAILAVAAAVGLVLLIPGMGTVLNPLSIEGPGSSAGSRVLVWRRALGMIQDFPFTGVGLGAFGYTADHMYTFYVVPTPFPHAHNLFLQLAVDLGFPGLVVWLSLVVTAARCAWTLHIAGRSRQHTLSAIIGVAMLGTLTVYLVHGLTDAVTWGMTRPAVAIWSLLGVLIVAYQHDRAARSVRVPPSSQSHAHPAEQPITLAPPVVSTDQRT